MSSKLTLAAAAAVAGALAAVYFLLPTTPATPLVNPPAPAPVATVAPASRPAAGRPHAAPETRPADPPGTPTPVTATTATGAAAATAAQTPATEAEYEAQLNAQAVQVRRQLAGSADRQYAIADVGNTTSLRTLMLNSSVGAFDLSHSEEHRTATDSLKQAPAGGAIPAFAYDDFKVTRSAAAVVDSSLLSGQSITTAVTSSGGGVQIDMTGPHTAVKIDPAMRRLTLEDLFPAARPVQYTSQAVLERAGLSLPEPVELKTLLQAAADADAAFLTAAQAFVAGKNNTPAAANLWPAAQNLQRTQLVVAAKVEEYLKAQQSGPDAWSAFSVTHQEHLGLLPRAIMALVAAPSGNTTGKVQAEVVIPPTTKTLDELKQGAGEVSVTLGYGADSAKPQVKVGQAPSGSTLQVHSPAVNPAKSSPIPAGVAGTAYCLETKGESLGHLAQVISANLREECELTVDPAIVGVQVEGKLQAAQLETLLQKIADTAKVELQKTGKGRWSLAPKSSVGDKPAGGDGF